MKFKLKKFKRKEAIYIPNQQCKTWDYGEQARSRELNLLRRRMYQFKNK